MSQYKVDRINAVQNFEVYTMTDKAKRDRMYANFRANGDENERQAVKFSGCEIVLDNSGKPAYTVSGLTREESERFLNIDNKLDPKTTKELAKLLRPVYRSTWSVAYPSGRG